MSARKIAPKMNARPLTGSHMNGKPAGAFQTLKKRFPINACERVAELFDQMA
jgi:hypothetical protein